METNPLRGLFGVSSPQPEEQRDAPQPTKPYENIHFDSSNNEDEYEALLYGLRMAISLGV